MIKPYKGKFHTEWYEKVASTEFAENDLTYIDTNGYLTPAVDGTLFKPAGLIQKVIASTDSDYASTTKVPVLVGNAEAEYLCEVGTGTAATTDIGEWVDIDDATSVDVTASTYDVFFVTDIIATDSVVAKLGVKSGAAA